MGGPGESNKVEAKSAVLRRVAGPVAALALCALALYRARHRVHHVRRAAPLLDYVRRFPVALVRGSGRIEAFATLWESDGREELSVDLMRHLPDAPSGMMDFLFTHLMLRGREEGYRWFNLGMAPLSGLPQHELAPLWNRIGGFLFRYGEHFYNFNWLRKYKEKFDPEWRQRYLASPGGLALPKVLGDLSSLISGGFGGLVGK